MGVTFPSARSSRRVSVQIPNGELLILRELVAVQLMVNTTQSTTSDLPILAIFPFWVAALEPSKRPSTKREVWQLHQAPRNRGCSLFLAFQVPNG